MSDGEHETLEPVDPAAPADGNGQAPADHRRGRVLRALPWALLVLAVAVAALSTWGYWRVADLAAEEQERAAVERVAGEFMVDLTNWDAGEGMAETRERLREAGTERFAGEVEELFGSTEDLAGLAELNAVSEGEVRRNYVQELGDDRALALVVVGQRITSDAAEEPEVSDRYAEVELLRVSGGDPDGIGSRLQGLFTGPGSASEWRVDAVDLLVDAAQAQQPAAPGAGADEEETP